MDDFEKQVMSSLQVLETSIIQICRTQHQLIVSLKEYCEKRDKCKLNTTL